MITTLWQGRNRIDSEKQPRIDTTIDALFGGTEPWTPPLAQYVNMCYYSYIPISYQRSIRIETREPNVHPFWGPRRIFFQIAAETLPAGTAVESYPRSFTPDQLAAAADVAHAWTEAIESRAVNVPVESAHTIVAPGRRADVFFKAGGGTVTEWSLQVEPSEAEGWSRIGLRRLECKFRPDAVPGRSIPPPASGSGILRVLLPDGF